jgi:hypothetical protein
MPITYWAPAGGDDGYGNPTMLPPIYFKGHWSDKDQTFLSARGEQIVSRATVHYPEEVTVVPDGWLFNGVSTAANPHDVPGAIIIRKVTTVPNIRNLEEIKVAMV